MKKTIFIIEDDTHVLSMMKNYFEYLDYHIITASNGLDGLCEWTRNYLCGQRKIPQLTDYRNHCVWETP